MQGGLMLSALFTCASSNETYLNAPSHAEGDAVPDHLRGHHCHAVREHAAGADNGAYAIACVLQVVQEGHHCGARGLRIEDLKVAESGREGHVGTCGSW